MFVAFCIEKFNLGGKDRSQCWSGTRKCRHFLETFRVKWLGIILTHAHLKRLLRINRLQSVIGETWRRTGSFACWRKVKSETEVMLVSLVNLEQWLQLYTVDKLSDGLPVFQLLVRPRVSESFSSSGKENKKQPFTGKFRDCCTQASSSFLVFVAPLEFAVEFRRELWS